MAKSVALVAAVLPMAVFATVFRQLQCSDDKCTMDCKTVDFNLDQCVKGDQGDSFMHLTCSSSGATMLRFSGNSNCTGQGTSETDDVGVCHVDGSTSYSNTCADGIAKNLARSIKVKVPANPANAPLTVLRQMQCTDGKCTTNCKFDVFNLNQCVHGTQNDSFIFLTCDSNGVHRLQFTGTTCQGPGTSDDDDVGVCHEDGAGDASYMNTCADGHAKITAKIFRTLGSHSKSIGKVIV